jgi:NAD(P)-dependent dehydrogenase (short-subunit alcohol dehydrogenase family)
MARGGIGSLLMGMGLGYAAYRAWRPDPISLEGRVAIVTGGSRGLGLLVAEELARQGCRVALCARDAEELERAEDRLRALGAEALTAVCDVSDAAQVRRFVGIVEQRFGRGDVLVANAGVIQVGPLASQTLADFELAMDVNYWGVVHAALAVLPGMKQRGFGRIATISSIGGRVAVPHLLPYSASKFAVRGFSEGLAAELAGTNIRVTTVLPGLMRTGSPSNALFKGAQGAEFTWFAAADSVPGLTIAAEDAARQVVEALRRGDAEVTLSWPAKLLGLIHDLAPSLTIGLMALTNRLLPKADGPTDTERGADVTLPRGTEGVRRAVDRVGATTNQL